MPHLFVMNGYKKKLGMLIITILNPCKELLIFQSTINRPTPSNVNE